MTAKETSQNHDSKGRFAKGNTLSKGRPKGSGNRILLQCREYAEQILPSIFEKALQGDLEAQKLILTHGMPKVKPEAIAQAMPIEKADILEAVNNGEISLDNALQLVELIEKTADKGDGFEKIDEFLKTLGAENL